MFLVAAGVDETGIDMTESISKTIQSVNGGYAVIMGLFSLAAKHKSDVQNA